MDSLEIKKEEDYKVDVFVHIFMLYCSAMRSAIMDPNLVPHCFCADGSH
uniref:Uncharacterized protein n=1 Tax=Arundo donax TaxID=35708 RepID=A0A0A9HLL8_ARUDO